MKKRDDRNVSMKKVRDAEQLNYNGFLFLLNNQTQKFECAWNVLAVLILWMRAGVCLSHANLYKNLSVKMAHFYTFKLIHFHFIYITFLFLFSAWIAQKISRLRLVVKLMDKTERGSIRSKEGKNIHIVHDFLLLSSGEGLIAWFSIAFRIDTNKCSSGK